MQYKNIILKPKDEVFDLISLSDFVGPALISVLTSKNTSLLHIPYFTEDISKKGFFVRTNNNKSRIVLGRELDPNIYRGQCKNFKFIPKLQRINNELEHCIEYIKKEEFKLLFTQTPYYKNFSKMQIMGYDFEFDLEAIAQHYGFATNYLDITKDIKTALFFAYTDCKNGNYFPIDDFKKYEPTLYVANYAFLEMHNLLTTVGFQSVLRPQKQTAMALNTDNTNHDARSFFRKIELPKDRDMAYGIFNSFAEGRDLFPDEPIKHFEYKIKTAKTLNLDLFENYCAKFKRNRDEYQKMLYKKGYEFSNTNYLIDSDIETKMEKQCAEELLPWIKQNISYRKVKRPKDYNENFYMDIYVNSL